MEIRRGGEAKLYPGDNLPTLGVWAYRPLPQLA